MKLKNKKTGEIVEFKIHKYVGLSDDGNPIYAPFKSSIEEWEDYEEPKTYYYISDFGAIREGDVGKFVEDEIARKEIGNYFETKEEAEKAVEKPKAWKRLKDKGFRFELWDFDGGNYHEKINTGRILFRVSDSVDDKDLDLLFGGEK